MRVSISSLLLCIAFISSSFAAPVVSTCTPPSLGCQTGQFCDGPTLSCVDVLLEGDKCSFNYQCDKGLTCNAKVCTATDPPVNNGTLPEPPSPPPPSSSFPLWAIVTISVGSALLLSGTIVLTMFLTKVGCFKPKSLDEAMPEMEERYSTAVREANRPSTRYLEDDEVSIERPPPRPKSSRPVTSASNYRKERPSSRHSRPHSSRNYYDRRDRYDRRREDYRRDYERRDYERREWERREWERREWERRERERREYEQRRAYEQRRHEQRREYEARALSPQGYIVRAPVIPPTPSGATTLNNSRAGSATSMVIPVRQDDDIYSLYSHQ